MTGGLTPRTHVLVAGMSTRAIAASAARAGFQVTAVDAFTDLDQHPDVRSLAVAGRYSPRAAVRASRAVACDAVAYLSSFENHPDVVRALACRRALWGNPPDVLRAVRDPYRLRDVWIRRGHGAPALGGSAIGRWLQKPVASGGGVEVRNWVSGAPTPPGHYLQEFIPGEPGSVAFLASPQGVRVLGVFQQLIGLPRFGASGFRYCGNILNDVRPSAATIRTAAKLADIVATEFGLVGVNGIDFVAQGEELYPIEVNPRWSASMELVERTRGISVFAAHARACQTGELASFDAVTAPPIGTCVGKGIVFARRAAVVGDTRAWCETGRVADVPRPETRIEAGQPVCTVFATEATPEGCRMALEAEATRVFAELDSWPSPR